MNELNFALQKAGYKSVILYGGIIVDFPSVSIAVGKDEDKEGLFMVYIQEDFEWGPKHTSLDDQKASDVMALCLSHVPAIAAQTPALG